MSAPPVGRAAHAEWGRRVVVGLCGFRNESRKGEQREVRRLLYEVSTTDPATFVTIASLPAGVAALSCHLPARRATGVDPMTALRRD